MGSAEDGTIAIDTARTERLRCCTVCGRRGLRTRFDVWLGTTLALGTCRCPDCYRQDPAGARRNTLLAERYGGENDENAEEEDDAGRSTTVPAL